MYFGDDAQDQLATILASQMSGDYFGLDYFGQDESALEADVIAADMLFEADPTPQNKVAQVQTRRKLAAARGGGGRAMQPQAAAAVVKNAAMQQVARQAMVRSAGKIPFSTTGEDTTAAALTSNLPTAAAITNEAACSDGFLGITKSTFGSTPILTADGEPIFTVDGHQILAQLS